MRWIQGLQRRRLMIIALVVACITAGSAAAWQASKLPAKGSSNISSADKQESQKRLRRGVGSEVRFAPAAAKREQIDEAVSSTADFIYWRSGLRMSDETKKDLAAAESNVLRGRAKHITLDELTDTLTATAVERLANITDEEILQASEQSSDENGEVSLRADGSWGFLTKKELIQQAKTGRDWSQRGDAALQDGLRSMIEEDVSNRVSTLAASLPEQFGQASAQGITPTQALLIAYSVATDDPLTDSRGDIEQMLVQKRMDAHQTREQKKAQKNIAGRPYGPGGLLHPSAPRLFLNKASVGSLLSLSEGGKK